MQDEQLEGLAKTVRGIVARRIMTRRDASQQPRKNGEFARKQRFDHAPLGGAQHRIERGRHIAGLTPDLVEVFEAIRVGEDMGDGVQPLIARRPVDAGELRQRFMIPENFFNQQIERAAMGALGFADQAPQTPAILRRIVQSVDMIEPQALNLVFRDQPADETMNAVERIAILDAKSRQRIHVKKSPVVDFTGRKLPVRQPVMLPLQQLMKGLGLRGPVGPGPVGCKA